MRHARSTFILATLGFCAGLTVGMAEGHAGPAKAVVAKPAPAQDAKGALACVDDIAKLCKKVEGGGGRHLECLAKEQSELSDACAAEMKPIAQAVLEGRAACGKNIDKYCKKAVPGLGLGACLNENRNKLSKDCKTFIAQINTAVLFACTQDAKKHCQGVDGGGGRVIECLANHYDELGAVCKPAIRNVKRSILGWRADCGAEIDKHCPKVWPGWPAVACLEAHKAEASQKCQKRLSNAEKVYAFVCKADIETHCKDVKAGDGRIFECLRDHHENLKPACKYLVPARLGKK
jgi:hypothetical protein